MCRTTETESIRNARKAHRCDWCNQRIEVGQPYSRWRFFDSRDAATMHMHPECYEAMQDHGREEGGYGCIEFYPGEFTRGCTCERGTQPEHCGRCEDRLAKKSAAPAPEERE